ncbi:MAG: hypothetical protein LBE36_12720 [Flavobacteriaceae bacterium]|jgi:hypothetical protein|nr:hypothetical protein [Flavobacteriaceae bacterium]
MGRQNLEMKNLFKIFSVCMLVFGSMAFGQARTAVATTSGNPDVIAMANMVEAAAPDYVKGTDLVAAFCAQSVEEVNFVKRLQAYLDAGTSKQEILRTYDGREVKALRDYIAKIAPKKPFACINTVDFNGKGWFKKLLKAIVHVLCDFEIICLGDIID